MAQLVSAPGFEPHWGAAVEVNMANNEWSLWVVCLRICFVDQGCICLISRHFPFFVYVHMHQAQAFTIMSLQPCRRGWLVVAGA